MRKKLRVIMASPFVSKLLRHSAGLQRPEKSSQILEVRPSIPSEHRNGVESCWFHSNDRRNRI